MQEKKDSNYASFNWRTYRDKALTSAQATGLNYKAV
jgi:hypothetical protein